MNRLAAILFALVTLGCESRLWADSNLFSALPRIVLDRGYVSSKACLECHKEEYHSWHRTFHRTMSKPALPENVQGDFSERKIDSNGLEYRIFKKGDEFWAEMPDPDIMMYVVQGKRRMRMEDIPRVQRRVVLTTGSHHYETYWVESPRYERLLQTLPLVYLLEDKRWAPRETVFMKGPADTERFVTQWNHHCIRCHSTGGNPGLNEDTGMLETRVAEFGISCEACHGPGQKHVELHRSLAGRVEIPPEPDPILNPRKLEARRSSDVCGQCHGVYIMREEFAMDFARHGPLYFPGEDLHKTRYYIQHPKTNTSPDRLAELENNPHFFRERWWDDGTILAGGREYTAMSASACYTGEKLSCLSCHSMHKSNPVDQLRPFANENQQCVQCHVEAKYTTDIRRHTFHAPGSKGSECLNCHMPHTTYALLKGIRSHQIDFPRVAASANHGVPNACNLCHLDQTLAWTQTNLHTWFKTPEVPLPAEHHQIAASLVWLLKGDAAQRAIVAWHYGWAPAQEASGTNWMTPFLSQLLNDSYGVVRYIAGRSARSIHDNFRFDFLAAPGERQTAALELLNRWRFDARQRSAWDELLLNADGTFRVAEMTRLRRQRDQRSVTIKE